jgi:hypothetical protein
MITMQKEFKKMQATGHDWQRLVSRDHTELKSSEVIVIHEVMF